PPSASASSRDPNIRACSRAGNGSWRLPAEEPENGPGRSLPTACTRRHPRRRRCAVDLQSDRTSVASTTPCIRLANTVLDQRILSSGEVLGQAVRSWLVG